MIEITDFRKDKYHFEEVFCTFREAYMVSKDTFTAYFDDTFVTYRIVIHCYMVEGDNNHVFTDFYAVPSFQFWSLNGFLEMSSFALVNHDVPYEDFSVKTHKGDYYWLAVEKNDDRVVPFLNKIYTIDLNNECENLLLYHRPIFALLNFYVNHEVDFDELTDLSNSNRYFGDFAYNIECGRLRDLGSFFRKILNHISNVEGEVR